MNVALHDQRLHCQLHWNGHRVTGVTLRSGRLLEVSRLFTGRTPEEVLTLLPRLYTLCGQAHTAAARLALFPDSPPAAETQRRVQIENLREHLLHLFVHWPEAGEQTPAAGELAPALALASAQLATPHETATRRKLLTWIETHVLGMPADDFQAFDESGLRAWAQQGSTLPARLLRETLTLPVVPQPTVRPLRRDDLDAVARALSTADATRFVAHPVLVDGCRHTGPATEEPSAGPGALLPPLGRHLAARLRTLARLCHSLASPEAGDDALFRAAGLGCAQTSRGLLVHRARVTDGRVSDYRILAPTEWNFHPRGLAARWLARIETEDRRTLYRLAARIVRALDPCVAFDIGIDEGGQLPEAAHA